MQVTLIAMVGTVGLNAQEPVSFQSIMGVYFGVILRLLLSALVQRFFGPFFLNGKFVIAFLSSFVFLECNPVVAPARRPAWIYQRLALIPAEAMKWIAVMDKPDCPPDEPGAFANTFKPCVAQQDISRCPAANFFLVPDQQSAQGRKALRALREVMDSELYSQIDLFRLREVSIPSKSALEDALKQMHEWVDGLRSWILANKVPVKDSIHLLGLANRFEMAGEELLTASTQAASLRLRLYLGDYIL